MFFYQTPLLDFPSLRKEKDTMCVFNFASYISCGQEKAGSGIGKQCFVYFLSLFLNCATFLSNVDLCFIEYSREEIFKLEVVLPGYGTS